MYDIIIIGGGPAGLTAGIYGAMANKKVLILEKTFVGGQVAVINKIKNYPAFTEIDGFELSNKMREQVVSLGVKIVQEEVVDVNLEENIKTITTHKNAYTAKCVIIATGAFARQLEVTNEKEFYGKGLSYCATCDGNFFKDKVVAVVGGGDASFTDCIYLSNLAKKIYLIHRRDVFTAKESLKNSVFALGNNKLEVLPNCVVTELKGNSVLQKIELQNKKTNSIFEIDVDGIFVAIGRKPDTNLFANKLNIDKNGYIITDNNMQTNLNAVYAVGDCRNTNLRQIVTACADGAVAVSHFVSLGL